MTQLSSIEGRSDAFPVNNCCARIRPSGCRLGIKASRCNKVNKQDTVTQDVTKHVNQIVNPVVLPAPTNRGTPTIRPDDLVNRILQGIGDDYSTAVVCEQAGISRQTPCTKMQVDRDLLDRYARTRARQMRGLSGGRDYRNCDDSSRDTYIDSKGQRVINHKAIAQAKLRIDARKWLAAKLAPKKYGKG